MSDDTKLPPLPPSKVPLFLLEELSDRLEGALQLIAALWVTDMEKARKLHPDSPEKLLAWAESMRGDLDGNRKEDLEKVLLRGFLQNTHAGFPLGSLSNPITGHYTLYGEWESFEQFCRNYGQGVGEVFDLDDLESIVKRQFSAKPIHPLLLQEASLLLLDAFGDRILHDKAKE